MLNDSSICTRRGLDTQPVNSYNQSRGARGARGASAARGTTGQVTRDSLSRALRDTGISNARSSDLRNATNPPRSAPRGTSKEPSQSSLAAPRNAIKSVLRSDPIYEFLNQDDIIFSDVTTVVVTVNSYNQALLDSLCESLNQENQASKPIDEEDVSTEHNENPPEVFSDEEEEAVTRLYIPSSEEIWMDKF